MHPPENPIISKDADEPEVYSFDVFDTCVSRRYAYPRDVFHELGIRLAPSGLGKRAALRFAREFQRRRIRAEKRAYRDLRPHECANIEEIYERFVAPTGLAISREALVAAEIALERESIYPVPGMVAHIDRLRGAGHRIIFISDMYLPASVLGPLLRALGVMRDGDALYVSCDARLTKHSGNLYRHVLAEERVKPCRIIHTGDNNWADVKRARDAGFQARHFSMSTLTSHEEAIAGTKVPRPSARSFLPALSRRARLLLHGQSSDEAHPLDGVMQSIIAPFVVAYVDWVLEQAAINEVKRLYFVARDGEILLRIAEVLIGTRSAPELRYLHGSRRAWLSPSIAMETRGWERFLVTPAQSNSRCDILARAGVADRHQLAMRDALAITDEEWSEPLDAAAAQAFIATIRGSKVASALMQQTAAINREAASSYFVQQGMLDGSKWALVDAGWSLNSQAALARILQTAGYRGLPHGYYIGLTRDHLPTQEAGTAEAFVSPPGNIFSRRRVIIEHCFMPSTQSTTRSYHFEGTEARPVFGPELRSPTELAYAARLHRTAVELARSLATDSRLAEDFRLHRDAAVAGAERFLRHPRPSDASQMAGFGTVADLRHDKDFVEPLCRPLGLVDVGMILRMTLSQRHNFSTPSIMWLEGSSALSPFYVRLPVAIMLALDNLRQRWRSL
jgi:predicted HAD superfamily hydrolase